MTQDSQPTTSNLSNETLERNLKNWTIKSNFIAVLSAIIMGSTFAYGFYYNTNSQLKANTENISNIMDDLDKINDMVTENAVFKGTSQVELSSLKDQVKRIEDKQDKLLEMMGSYFSSETNKK